MNSNRFYRAAFEWQRLRNKQTPLFVACALSQRIPEAEIRVGILANEEEHKIGAWIVIRGDVFICCQDDAHFTEFDQNVSRWVSHNTHRFRKLKQERRKLKSAARKMRGNIGFVLHDPLFKDLCDYIQYF